MVSAEEMVRYGSVKRRKTQLSVPDGSVNAVVYRDILENDCHKEKGCMETSFSCKTTTLDQLL